MSQDKSWSILDEVGELPPEAQVKLLRTLGEKEIVKVGGTKTIPTDVRVIAATNKNLEDGVSKPNAGVEPGRTAPRRRRAACCGYNT